MATELRQRPSLRRRLLAWLFGYIAVLSLILIVSGAVLYEQAERTAWHSLLNAEMDRHLQREAEDPGYRWRDGHDLRLFRWDGAPLPPDDVAPMGPGLHDDVWVEGKLSVVLVRDSPEGRLALALDITQFETVEINVGVRALLLLLLAVLALGALLAVAIGRSVRPLATLADAIARLRPERGRQRIETGPQDSRELQVIADAFNDYLQRNERFVERERAFIDTASHELRTPIAAISGAAQLAAQQQDLNPAAREQVQRVRHGAQQVEQLIALLLVLAKDPKRLAAAADRIDLHELVPEIVDDHRYLCREKQLEVQVDQLAHSEIVAPMAVVRAAIGNLLRNAIEHSDSGTVHVRLDADAGVTIADPGHGMDPEEVARIYARLAHGESRDGGGIGLDLIARLCEHLGWRLDIHANPDGGTVATLRFKPAD